jgi:hypothetical protein
MSASAFGGSGPGPSREDSTRDGAWAQVAVTAMNKAAIAAAEARDMIFSAGFPRQV